MTNKRLDPQHTHMRTTPPALWLFDRFSNRVGQPGYLSASVSFFFYLWLFAASLERCVENGCSPPSPLDGRACVFLGEASHGCPFADMDREWNQRQMSRRQDRLCVGQQTGHLMLVCARDAGQSMDRS